MNALFTLHQNKVAWVGGIAFLALLVGAYIFQINDLTAQAYYAASQEEGIAALQEESRELEMRYVQLSSFRDMDEMAKVLQFEKIAHTTYLEVETGTVAQSSGSLFR